MKPSLLTLALILAVVALFGVLIAWSLFWDSFWVCEETVLSEQESPDEALVFSVHRRDCGATTGFVTGLSIRRTGDDLDASAGDDVLIIDGDVPVTASWTDVDKIEVDVPKGAEIFRSEQKWEGITITYRTN